MVKAIQIMDLERPDECCGFGGTFCVSEEAVSAKMGNAGTSKRVFWGMVQKERH